MRRSTNLRTGEVMSHSTSKAANGLMMIAICHVSMQTTVRSKPYRESPER